MRRIYISKRVSSFNHTNCIYTYYRFFEKAIDHAYSDIKQSHIDSLKDPINKMFNSLKNQMEKIIKRNTYIQGQSRYEKHVPSYYTAIIVPQFSPSTLI